MRTPTNEGFRCPVCQAELTARQIRSLWSRYTLSMRKQPGRRPSLTLQQQDEAGRRHVGGESQTELAADFGVSTSTMSRLISRPRYWLFQQAVRFLNQSLTGSLSRHELFTKMRLDLPSAVGARSKFERALADPEVVDAAGLVIQGDRISLKRCS